MFGRFSKYPIKLSNFLVDKNNNIDDNNISIKNMKPKNVSVLNNESSSLISKKLSMNLNFKKKLPKGLITKKGKTKINFIINVNTKKYFFVFVKTIIKISTDIENRQHDRYHINNTISNVIL